MKRILFLAIFACLFCFLAFNASAAPFGGEVTDTFYVVASQDSEAALSLKAEGKDVIVLSEVYASVSSPTSSDWINSFAEGSHIELIFAENIIEAVGEYTGILLDKATTLTVRYNGYVHLVTNTKMDKPNLFVLKHSGASINLIGSSQIYDEKGDVIMDFTYSTTDLEKNMLQIRHPKVYCWVYDGNAYVENIRAYTGQELVYTDNDNSGADPSVSNTYEFVDCALSSGSSPIGLLGQGSAWKIIKISGGYYSSVDIHSILSGSYIENCTIDKFKLDCWGLSGAMLVFRNTTINGSITTETGRTHISFYDCTFDITKMSLGSDGAGKSYAIVYTSADCENDGTVNVYRNGNGSTPVNDDSKYAQTVIDFYADPASYASGHDVIWSYGFAGDKYVSAFTATNGCSKCGNTVEAITVESLFVTLGYSVPTFGTDISITVGYAVNTEAIEQYEALTGAKINFGCVIAAKDRLGEGVAPLDENGNAVTLPQGQVIKADVTDNVFDQMNLKVTLNESYKDALLLMTGYVIEATDSGVAVSYMQDNSSLVYDNNFEFISFNSFQ